LAHRLLSSDQRDVVRKFRRLSAVWEENRDLVAVGAYKAGSDPELDEALKRQAVMREFLSQDADERIDFDTGFEQLSRVLS
jgi:flagellum-specific ATP synthase